MKPPQNPTARPPSRVFHLGLLGYPLGHSLSPRLHTAALSACGLNGDYALFPIPPDDLPGLRALLQRLRTGELHGLNVTIPHKQSVLPLLDELSETARSIGAVNTVMLREGRLVGDNTDAAGFMADLQESIKDRSFERASALVLGAGGAARAVAFALSRAGWRVSIAARRPEQAANLARSLQSAQLHIITNTLDALEGWQGELLVNTTPLGMFPDVAATPWTAPFPAGAAVYDLVYNPRETRLVREARAAGLSAVAGLGMLVEQAALAFELWSGCRPPRTALWQALDERQE